jgi:GTP-binding protein HflX
LEEVGAADVIVHVVDASHPDPGAQLATVRDVISDVGARDVPEIVVFNKADLISSNTSLLLRGLAPDAIFVSAKTGEGIDVLMTRIDTLLPRPSIPIRVLIPFDRGDLVASLHDSAIITRTDYGEEGTIIDALIEEKMLDTLAPFRTVAN